MIKDFSETSLKKHLSGMSILLVGGAGFIGHNLALKLAKFGANVSILDNLMINSIVDSSYDNTENLLKRNLNQHFLYSRIELLKENKISLINGDARFNDDLRDAFEETKCQKVVHLSAIASAVEAKKNPGLMFDLQLGSLKNILELSRSKNFNNIKQIMLLSSSTVYGDFKEDTVDETVRPRPRGIYANTKFMAERLIRTYSNQYNIGSVIIRPSALYGERCVSRRVSQMFIENALFGNSLFLEGGGDGKLDFTHIDDLTDGMVRALGFTNENEETNTFNLTFGNARSILDLANIIKELIPNVKLVNKPRANEKPIRGTLSIKRAKDLIGFNPQMSLDIGYKKYCEWYIEQYQKVKNDLNFLTKPNDKSI